jgi:hypothetical protein
MMPGRFAVHIRYISRKALLEILTEKWSAYGWTAADFNIVVRILHAMPPLITGLKASSDRG